MCGSVTGSAQVNTCGNTTLSCLLPTAMHTSGPTFNFFNEAFATQIGQLPLATPASGYTFTWDPIHHVYTSSAAGFGPILSERAETIGRYKAYLSFTYQHFGFSDIDGNSLKNLPILFYFPTQDSPTVVTDTQNRVDTSVNQYVVYGTFGVTDRIDVSFAVPFERVSLAVGSKGTEYSTTSSATAPFTEYLSGSASGIGDVVLAAKTTVLRRQAFAIAIGAELRFPSGNPLNYLGSGAFGAKPYFVLSRRAKGYKDSPHWEWGRVSPHLNLAYQWNDTSVLATGPDGKEENLPGFFGYAVGADAWLTERITVAADLVGQEYFGAAQVSTPGNVTVMVNNHSTMFSTIEPINGSYNVNNLALGVKASPWKQLLVTGNITIKLNNAGLRANVVPLAGISYTF